MSKSEGAEDKVREIRRKARRKYSAEENIRIVLEGLRGEESISELCRREGIAHNLYYSWSKEFLEAGKRRLMMLVHHDDAAREFVYDRKSHIGRLDKGLGMAHQNGWTLISMKNDFGQVFPKCNK